MTIFNGEISVVGDCLFETTILSSRKINNNDADIDFKSKFFHCYGGAAYGVAKMLSAVGFDVNFMTLVGTDLVSKSILNDFIQSNINREGVISFKGEMPQCINVIYKDQRVLFLDQTSIEKFHVPSDSIKKWLKKVNSKYLYATCPPWAKDVLRLAKEKAMFIITDIQKDFSSAYHKEFIKYSDIIIISLENLNTSESINKLKQFYNDYGKSTIGTRGKKGCLMIGFNDDRIQKLIPKNIVLGNKFNNLGAGDAFGSGLVVGLSLGHSITASIKFGQVFASNMLNENYYCLNLKKLKGEIAKTI